MSWYYRTYSHENAVFMIGAGVLLVPYSYLNIV
jgi:hypothetical protein